MPVYGQCDQRNGGLEPLCGRVDHCADRGFLDANRLDHARQGAQPMGGIDHLRTGDTWEEILGSAREPNHFMRESRPKDEDVIVFQCGLVDLDRDLVRQ